jgi:hypothetical protein
MHLLHKCICSFAGSFAGFCAGSLTGFHVDEDNPRHAQDIKIKELLFTFMKYLSANPKECHHVIIMFPAEVQIEDG